MMIVVSIRLDELERVTKTHLVLRRFGLERLTPFIL
jgi:hypothetical protein